MMIKLVRRVLALRVLYVSISFFSTLSATECIKHFDSDITIHDDASMTVTEELTVQVENHKIRHGIMREFPTRYKDLYGFNYNVSFDVKEVLQNGAPVPFNVVNYMNGKRLFIGDSQVLIKPGLYTYKIVYHTDRQLGFFDQFDQLYWNVTGLGWPFFIDEVTVHVHLPKNIKAQDIKAEGYTGSYKQAHKDFKVTHVSDGLVEFQTTYVLHPNQGFTIVVSWPKGKIAQPSYWWYYVRDNLHLLVLFISLLALLCFYLWVFRKTRSAIKKGTIIPLFYPPQNAGPGALGYVMAMKYDSKQLAATIVNLAVKGLLRIEQVPGSWLSQSHYVLKKSSTPLTQISSGHAQNDLKLANILFSSAQELALNTQQPSLSTAANFLKSSFERDYDIPFFQTHSEYVSFATLTSACIGLVAALIAPDAYLSLWFWVLLGLHFALNILFFALLPNYSQEGQQFSEQIEGFKIFLKTTETERLKVIGTPPTKTPELYETYLPYAIALGVEQQWSQQFAPVFKNFEQSGHPYQPHWYYAGHPFTPLDLVFLNSNFSNSFNNNLASSMKPISSSEYRPGSTSGSGGDGYSGGGGGGGGGGGW